MFQSISEKLNPGLKVHLTVEQESVFLAPAIDPSLPSQDPELRGTVLLTLTAPRAIQSVKVVFAAMQELYAADGNLVESSTPLQKELTLQLHGELLGPGVHAFNWAFIVPATADVYQRCRYGHVYHYVKATVQTAATTVSSCPLKIWLVACPAHVVINGPESFDLHFEHDDAHLGPLRFGVSSPHLAVSCLLRYHVHFMAPNALTIHSIALQFVQTFTVTYSDGKAVEMPVERLPTLPVASKCVPGSILAFDVPEDASAKPDPVPLTELQPGREYTHVKTVRAPNDDKVRPSTLEGCNHQVDVRHKIEVRIQYRLPGDKGLRHLTISRPCVIASCCASGANSFLPAYSAKDPTLVTKPKLAECTCDLSPKEMFDKDREVLVRPVEVFDKPDSERLLASERLNKSQAFTYIQAHGNFAST